MEKNLKLITYFFKTIGDKTRLQILLILQKQTLCVNDITKIMNMEQSAISHQLIYLKKMKFVKSIKTGKIVNYTLACHHISDLIDIANNHINKTGCK